MPAKPTMQLLVLAFTPDGQVLDWHPFDTSDKLEKIVNGVNTKCHDRLAKEWPQEDLDACLLLLDVLLYDLNSLTKLGRSDLRKVDVLLASIDDLLDGLEHKKDLSNRISARLSGRAYIFAQSSVKSNAQSIRDRFIDLSFSPTMPEVTYSQKDLEDCLANIVMVQAGLCHKFDDIDPKSSHIGSLRASVRVDARYQRSKSDLVAQVRNLAVERGMSVENASHLLRATAVQEYAIQSAADTVEKSAIGLGKSRTSIEALRPDLNLLADKLPTAIEQVQFQPVQLLELRLKQPFEALKPAQRVAAEKIGLRATNSSALHYDVPTLRAHLDQLGKAVKVNSFSAELPRFTVDASRGRFETV